MYRDIQETGTDCNNYMYHTVLRDIWQNVIDVKRQNSAAMWFYTEPELDTSQYILVEVF